LEEEVYVEQPKGLQLLENKNDVSNLKKALYGLTQAPKAWYSGLYKYPQQQGLKIETNINLYIKIDNEILLIIVVYVNDIIFGSDVDTMSKIFSRINVERI